VDGSIHAGLEQLVSAYLNRDWSRGGSLMRIDRLLVDMGYKAGIVADVKQKAGGAVMMLAKGVGLRASRKPIAEYARRPGENNRVLECRYCGCKHFRVVYTRPTYGGRIMRRRECRHCGKRMTTWERAGA
jgi:hypothetical protein